MMLRNRAVKTKNVLSASILTAVFGSFLAVGAAQSETLNEAVQQTVSTYPEIAEASANRRAVDQELEQAKGLYLPSLDLEAGIGYEWTDTVTIDNEDLRRTESSLLLVQTLYDGGFRSAEVDRQGNRVDSAAYRVKERAEAIALDAVRAYLDTLRSLEIVELAKENVEKHRRTLNEIQDRVRAGQSGIGDDQQALARLAAAEDTLVETMRALDDAEITYLRVVGAQPVNLELPVFQDGVLPDNIDDIVALALENNPDILFASSDIKTSEAEIRATQASYYPTVNLEVGASADNNLDGVEGHNDDFLAMLRLRYNLYRGGIDEGREKEAIARKAETEQRKLRFERLVEEEVRRSWSALARSEARAEVLAAAVVANREVASTYRQEFEIGQRDLLDLLDADNELFNSRTSLVTVEYAVRFAKYRLLATMGTLNSTLGVTLPQEATLPGKG
ncbi:TolC family outer membrane protein [Sneathiella chungangensis]|uniref:TolC family outer membrane protein n=1 Tax=Sneathiella chungangensis TaxID=1418234 RepID=A0A845MD82_9PROT|nr:TolC family outer membrane protein [Sneathiella chungangensis]MZR21993.1 TolC family outer membrane protein [Sneathiella chungangensis]